MPRLVLGLVLLWMKRRDAKTKHTTGAVRSRSVVMEMVAASVRPYVQSTVKCNVSGLLGHSAEVARRTR
jgi:hypothetical protein